MSERKPGEPATIDVDRMNFLEAEITKAILPYRENTEAAIVVAALMRCARKLIDRYNPVAKKQLTEVTVAYLERRLVVVDDERPQIIAPPGVFM